MPSDSTDYEFDRLYVYDGKQMLPVEGHVLRREYIPVNEQKETSELMMARNYENLVKSLGGVKVWSGEIPSEAVDKLGDDYRKYRGLDAGKSTDTYLIQQKDKEVWVQLLPNHYRYTLNVVERAAMPQKLTVAARCRIKKKLATEGHVALYLNFDTDKTHPAARGQADAGRGADAAHPKPRPAPGRRGPHRQRGHARPQPAAERRPCPRRSGRPAGPGHRPRPPERRRLRRDPAAWPTTPPKPAAPRIAAWSWCGSRSPLKGPPAEASGPFLLSQSFWRATCLLLAARERAHGDVVNGEVGAAAVGGDVEYVVGKLAVFGRAPRGRTLSAKSLLVSLKTSTSAKAFSGSM
ncbi:MAG: hypothetical protein WKG07_01720 [Hymenobacter sp.]